MSTLTKVQPIHAPTTPPEGAKAAGTTPDGRQIYRLVRKNARAVPDIDPETGQQRWRLHPATKEPLLAKNKAEVFDEELLFTMESQGNNNVVMVPWVPPSAAQLAEEERQRRVAEEGPKLVEAMLDAGLTPETLRALAAGQAPAPAEPAAPAPPEPAEDPLFPNPDRSDEPTTGVDDFPRFVAERRYELSNGSVFEGALPDAELAEAFLHEPEGDEGEDEDEDDEEDDL